MIQCKPVWQNIYATPIAALKNHCMNWLYSPELHVGQVKSAATLEWIFKGGLFIIENLLCHLNQTQTNLGISTEHWWQKNRCSTSAILVDDPGASTGTMSELLEAFSPDGILWEGTRTLKIRQSCRVWICTNSPTCTKEQLASRQLACWSSWTAKYPTKSWPHAKDQMKDSCQPSPWNFFDHVQQHRTLHNLDFWSGPGLDSSGHRQLHSGSVEEVFSTNLGHLNQQEDHIQYKRVSCGYIFDYFSCDLMCQSIKTASWLCFYIIKGEAWRQTYLFTASLEPHWRNTKPAMKETF